MKLICDSCGEDLEYYDDITDNRDGSETKVLVVLPCETCLDELAIDSRGLGYAQGALDLRPNDE